jgi:motility quorum-sensing regulator / GCU-specific mRNA interferase toxin
VEKRRPHHALSLIQAEFSTVRKLRMTKTAQDCAFALGLTLEDVKEIIQSLSPKHFYKAMTSHVSNAIWQDVYHIAWQGYVLYIKFTTNPEGYLVISFKEK